MRQRANSITVGGAALLAFIVGTAWASEDPVLARGLAHARTGHDVTARACALASALTGPLGYSLQVAGQGSTFEEATTIPVYVVTTAEGAATTPAAVPRGCRCVFVDLQALRAWVGAHATGTARFELSETNLLAFMLLHEVGHIHSATSAVRFADGALAQLNTSPSRAKANEEDADAFAAGLISTRLQQSASAASLAAHTMAMELTKLGWNMQAYRTLDEFGAAATGSRRVFFDVGYTHPNLAWRVLRSNDLIHRTEATRALLEAFEAARERGTEIAPLYRKED